MTTAPSRQMKVLAELAREPQPGLLEISRRFGWDSTEIPKSCVRALYRLGFVDSPYKRGPIGITAAGRKAVSQ